tara:strand:+ start:57 stop:869 length:813 start_codon:yes stop_codon:yes gene_type:complete
MNKIWINGKIVDAQNAISSSDRGFTLGDGIFETMYFDNGNIELFEMHMIRLKSTLSFLYINISYSHNDLINATRKLFEENKLSCGVVRLTVSRGCGKRGIAFNNELKATVVISVSVVDRFQAPVKICTTSYVRNEKSPLSSFKMLNYTDSIMAFNDAKMKGFGDALMLNIKGNVSCTTTANIFLIKGNNLITPSLKSGCLPGIIRSVVLNIAKKNNLNVAETDVKIEHMKTADSVFITNSIIRLKKIIGFEDTNYDLENKVMLNIEKELI